MPHPEIQAALTASQVAVRSIARSLEAEDLGQLESWEVSRHSSGTWVLKVVVASKRHRGALVYSLAGITGTLDPENEGSIYSSAFLEDLLTSKVQVDPSATTPVKL